MALIQLLDGDQLNSDNIIKFCRLRGGEIRFLDVNGNTHTGKVNDAEEKFSTVIPAAAGYTAIYAEHDHLIYSPVIGWRLHVGGTEPVIPCYIEGEYEAIIAPDGTVYDIDSNRFSTVDEWKADRDAA